MPAFTAALDQPSAQLVWIVGGVGVVSLIIATVLSLVVARRRRRPALPRRPARADGFTFDPPGRPPRPSQHRTEGAGGRTPGAGEADPVQTAVAAQVPPAREWMALWAAPRAAAGGGQTNDAAAPASDGGEPVGATPTAGGKAEAVQPGNEHVVEARSTPPAPSDVPQPSPHEVAPDVVTSPVPISDWPVIPSPPPSVLSSTTDDDDAVPGPLVAAGSEDVNLRGILRWLLFETDADAVVFLQVAPGGEQLFVEPRGLPDASVADLAARARAAVVAAAGGERTTGDVSTARWLGVGGSKLLLITGASPVAAAEPIRFARFAIEWLAGSRSGDVLHAHEDAARGVPGVAWAEMDPDGKLRVLPTEQTGDWSTAESLGRILPGQILHWVVAGPTAAEKRARLVDVYLTEMEGTPSAEVRLLWEGNELKGIGRGHTSLVGRHLAAARGAIDALKPLIHGMMHVEHLQVSTLPSDVEVVLVSVLVGEERMVGATLVRPDDEARAGAKAVLDAVNRRLVVIAGQSGQI